MTLATGDCETVHAGLLAQPVNALSSLAYLGAGAWLLWRREAWWYGAAVAFVGVGSFDFHGIQSPWARSAHGLGLVAVGVAVAARATAKPRRLRWALAALAAGGVLQAFGRTGGPLCAPDSLLQAHAGWHVLTAIALAVWGSR